MKNNPDIISIKEILNNPNIINDKTKFMINLFKLLSQLTDSPVLNYKDFLHIINNLPNNHHIFIYKSIEYQPIGIITIIIEQKLIHGGKCVGHIEDLVVDSNNKGQGIAKELLNYCIELANEKNCYKVILDCKKELIPFYNKVDFKQKGVCMRKEIV